MHRFAIAALALFASVCMQAQDKPVRMGKYGYPIYDDYSIPKPDKPLDISLQDLKLTDRYLGFYPNGIPEADASELRVLYNYYKDDPEGQAEWASLQEKALKCIPTWDMEKLIKKRYVYSLAQLKPLALLYIFTGNELVSDFIRGHLAKAASLPVDFWIHAELRRMDPAKPQGCIETSYINQAFGAAIEAVRRNMTAEEIATVETAWRQKGMQPAVNWMEAHPATNGNFTAVIGIGAMYAAKYFHDEAVWNLGLSQLKMYVDECILPDGSDYEGYNYYSYPASQILSATLVMTPEQIRSTFSESSIARTMHWRVAGMLFGHGPAGYPSPIRITWGDNPCAASMKGDTDLPTWLSALVCRDGVAAWIQETYSQKRNNKVVLLQHKLSGEDIKPTSPEEAGIPLLTTFKSGDCYMRSGWDDDCMVLGLKARNGNKEKKAYSHARPEINSLNLGAFGEYLICNAASASYRSPLRNAHDLRTWRANVVTVDEKDQIFPFSSFKKLGCYGYPDATITRREILPDGGMVLANEAREAYVTPMETALRTVRYVPEGKFFIVTDKLVPKDGASHRFDHRFFIFNHDFKTAISGKGGNITVRRPGADLYIAVKGSQKLDLEYREAFIHGLGGRDYDPGGKFEGKKGSAIGLQWSCEASSLDVISVLVPQKPGTRAPKIKIGDGYVSVNGVRYEI